MVLHDSLFVIAICVASVAQAQASRRPARANPPIFQPGQFTHLFPDDAENGLTGPRPRSSPATDAHNLAMADSSSPGAPQSPTVENGQSPNPLLAPSWQRLISTESIEDLVKESKLRLDQLLKSPTAFVGGGYQAARNELSLLSLMFNIVSEYPGETRWKKSAAAARLSMRRAAEMCRSGSRAAFEAARQSQQDLGDVLSGTGLADSMTTELPEHKGPLEIAPLMQLVDWAFKQQVQIHTANAQQFQRYRMELLRHAELIAVLASVTMQPDMPNADDPQFVELASELVQTAQKLGRAIRSDEAQAASSLAISMGQSCIQCHEAYR
ncbi:MAG: hypothetical protein KF752_10905 [Pirellulaceae bacterium]|nr:hypothetical protein [Pirellulaceae bacterium]